jgi:hypothetical protein
MNDGMIRVARAYLRRGGGVGEDQAVVVVSHWEDEVPWGVEEGVKRFSWKGAWYAGTAEGWCSVPTKAGIGTCPHTHLPGPGILW